MSGDIREPQIPEWVKDRMHRLRRQLEADCRDLGNQVMETIIQPFCDKHDTVYELSNVGPRFLFPDDVNALALGADEEETAYIKVLREEVYDLVYMLSKRMPTNKCLSGYTEDYNPRTAPPEVRGWRPQDREVIVDTQGYEYHWDSAYVLVRDGRVAAQVEPGSGLYNRAHVFDEDMDCIYAAELGVDDGDYFDADDDKMLGARRWCVERLEERIGGEE